jgi:hypothetical protein
MTVYVTQETNHDYRPAEAWGKIKFLTDGDLNNTKGSLANERLVREIRQQLKHFNPNEDWVVISGSPYVSALVFTLLGLAHHRQINVLRWDNRDLIYRPMYIEIPRVDLAEISQ